MNALLRSLALPLLALSVAAEDRITLTDGSTIDGRVTDEGLKSVKVKVDSKTKTIDSDTILKIEYERKPEAVDAADTFAAEGAVLDAIDAMNLYVEELGGKGDRRFGWAPAYALARVVEMQESIGDAKAVVAAAEALIKAAPESRYIPMAYLSKAEAQTTLKQKGQAQRTLNDFLRVVDSQSLSERWRLEVRLGTHVNDASLSGGDLRDQLDQLAAEAGSEFPTVRNKARVAIGESFLSGTPNYSEARSIFETILGDPKADDTTLAGAHTGLGSCIFQIAASKVQKNEDATSELKDALKHFLRVVVVYPDENSYRAKALFYAGRSYQLIGDADGKARERARALLKAVMREYPGSSWAAEAEKAR